MHLQCTFVIRLSIYENPMRRQVERADTASDTARFIILFIIIHSRFVIALLDKQIRVKTNFSRETKPTIAIRLAVSKVSRWCPIGPIGAIIIFERDCKPRKSKRSVSLTYRADISYVRVKCASCEKSLAVFPSRPRVLAFT